MTANESSPTSPPNILYSCTAYHAHNALLEIRTANNKLVTATLTAPVALPLLLQTIIALIENPSPNDAPRPRRREKKT